MPPFQSGNYQLMNNSIDFDPQDLPEQGPCPICSSEARFREVNRSKERYRIDCPSCGKFYGYLDSLEDTIGQK